MVNLSECCFQNIPRASHYQGNKQYEASAGILCSCLSLVSVAWSFIRNVSPWDFFDFDHILASRNELLNYINKLQLLGTDDSPTEFALQECRNNLDFLENRLWEIALNAFMISPVEIISGCNNLDNKICQIYQSHSRGENGEVLTNCAAVLLKFKSLHQMERCIKHVYYQGNRETMYFQLQFIKCLYSEDIKLRIVFDLELKQLRVRGRREGEKIQ